MKKIIGIVLLFQLIIANVLSIGVFQTYGAQSSKEDPEYTTLRNIDRGTFNEYRYRITEKFYTLRNHFQVNRVMHTATLKELQILAKTGYRYLPNNLKNKNYLEKLYIDIDKGIKQPMNESVYVELLESLSNYVDNIEISSIQGEIIASPQSGNAPLTVTFRARVEDPSGTQILPGNYTWWVDRAGRRSVIGRGISLNHTFKEEGKYTVFLDVTSSHKNAEGYTDVLPFRERVEINVNEKIASVILKINGARVDDINEIKFTPEDANYGLIFDATSSLPSDGTKFTKTTWDFGNGIKRNYRGGPKIERVRYAREGEYDVIMKLETNEGKTIEKKFVVYVHDPIATIDVNKEDGFIGDMFTFSAKSSGIYRNLTYNWEIINIDTDEVIFQKSDRIFTYAFTKKGKFNVRLKVRRSSGEIDQDTRIVYVTSQSPVAEFSVDTPFSNKPNRVFLDASRSYDPDVVDDGKLRYDWYIDGNRVNLEEASNNGALGYHTFDSIGSHSINLEVTDPDGITATKKTDVKIDSILGVEFFTFPRVIQREGFIKFVADAPEAEFFEWDFGDGKTQAGKLDKVTHTYDKSGTFTVTLKVSDKNNVTNNYSRKVYVSESDSPFAHIGVSYGSNDKIEFDSNACGGGAFVVDRVNSYSFDGAESINIDGTSSKLSYTWKIGRSKFSNAQTVSHRFDEIGCFPVKLTVKSDTNGATHATDMMVNVRNLKPVLSSLSISQENPEADPLIVRVTAQGASDPDGIIQSYLWYYYTDTDTEPQEFRSTLSPSTTFVIPKVTGNYYFVAVLKDNNETRVSSEEVASRYFITITGDNINTPIVDLAINNSSVIVGEEVVFSAKAKNILGKNIGKEAEFSWDFDGDGFYDTQTTDGTTTYKYKKSGEFYAKVKVKYRGISSTKNVTVNVNNKLTADFEYISIGNRFIFFDTSSGLVESREWDLGDGTKKSGSYFEHTYTDKVPLHNVTLRISEGSKTETITQSVQKNIKNILKSRKENLVVFSSPVIEKDTITLKSSGQKVFIYLGESNGEISAYAIDYDTEQDSDLNGGSDDDEDNIGTASYKNGDIIEIPLSNFRQQKIRIFTKDTEGKVSGSEDITIIKEYIDEELIDADDIVFEDVTESEKQKIEALKEIMSTLPQQQKLKAMNYIQKLQENWNDSTEKTRTILDFENFIFELKHKDEETIISLLESLLVEGQEDQSSKQITYQALIDLIPEDINCEVSGSGSCYEELVSKLTHIRNSDDIESNKALGKEILDAVGGTDLMTNKQKVDYKAILTSLVYGNTDKIPTSEKEEVVNESKQELDSNTESKGIMGTLFTIFKVLAWIFGIFLLGVIVFFFYYKFSSRDTNQSFGDFVKKKTDSDNDDLGSKDDILASMDDTNSDILSSISSSDPLKAENTSQNSTKNVKAENIKLQEESQANSEKKDEVPDWLKGNFAGPKQDSASKKIETPKADVPKVPEAKPEAKVETKSSIPKSVVPAEKTSSSEVKTETKAEVALSEDDTALPKQDENIPDWLKGSFTETPKAEEKITNSKDVKEAAKQEDTPASTKVETPKIPETPKEVAKADTSTVPDWLKGAMEDEKKTEDKEENKTSTPKVSEAKKGTSDSKTSSSKKSSTPKTPAKAAATKQEDSKEDIKVSKVNESKTITKKKALPNEEKVKKEDELWDDGMKIPDWLRSDDDTK